MSAKDIYFDAKARGLLAKGVNTLADAVKVTPGPPRGATCSSKRALAPPIITKDGVTVAKEIELENKFENMGAQMVKEVASKTSDVAGDGTTPPRHPSLAQAIFNEGVEARGRGPQRHGHQARHRQGCRCPGRRTRQHHQPHP